MKIRRSVTGWCVFGAGLILTVLAAGCGLALGLGDYSQAACNDGLQDGDETGIDCGGSCAACDPAAACGDGARNGGETDIDCGGQCSTKCDVGRGCVVGPDCITFVCGNGTCLSPSCADQVTNGDETAIDCGGTCPTACKDNLGCVTGDDCISQVCDTGICAPNHVSSFAFEGASNTHAFVNANGNLILAGTFNKTLTIESDVLKPIGKDDIFVAKFDPKGALLWAKFFGSAEDETAAAAVDNKGNIILTGTFIAPLDFGGGALTSAGAKDVYFAKLDPSGAHVFSQSFGNIANQEGLDVAVDAAGAIVLTGTCAGSINLGGATLTCPNEDVFLAKFNETGAHVWSIRLGDQGSDYQRGSGVAIGPAGDIAVTGSFHGTMDIGGGKSLTANGFDDVFVAKYTTAGTTLWGKAFGQKFGNAQGVRIASDSNGNLIASGTFMNTLDLGNGPLDSAGDLDWWVLKLDGAGQSLWSKSFGTEQADIFPLLVAAHEDGSLTLGGSFAGTIDFGGGPMTTDPGSTDVFIARLDSSGKHRWSKQYPVSILSVTSGLAATGPDTAIIAGAFAGTVDFGGGPLTADPNVGSTFVTQLRVP